MNDNTEEIKYLQIEITMSDLPVADGHTFETQCPSVDKALPTLALPIQDPSFESLGYEKDLLQNKAKKRQRKEYLNSFICC